MQPGEIEVDVDSDRRYAIKLQWYEKMLGRWKGDAISEDLDGSPWEGGWNAFMRISWGLI